MKQTTLIIIMLISVIVNGQIITYPETYKEDINVKIG